MDIIPIFSSFELMFAGWSGGLREERCCQTGYRFDERNGWQASIAERL